MCIQKTNWVEEIGKLAYESISEMVSALTCDRDRLEELRDAKTDYEDEHCHDTDSASWEDENPEDAEELAQLEAAVVIDNEEVDEDTARERIMEDPLSLRIFGERIDGEWEPTSYELLLSTGGPAVRIVGKLDGCCATSARLEVQDWFRPWTEYPADEDLLKDYVECFCFE